MAPLDVNLLTSALGAVMGRPVVTYDQHQQNPIPGYVDLGVDDFQKHIMPAPVPEVDPDLPKPTKPSGGQQEIAKQLQALITQQQGLLQQQQGLLLQQNLLHEQQGLVEYQQLARQQQDLIRQMQMLLQQQHDMTLEKSRTITIFVKTLSGQTITITVTQADTVLDVKLKIQAKAGIPVKDQRLTYGGKQCEDTHNIHDYDIHQDSTLQMLPTLPGGGPPGVILPKDFLSPGYDYDFTHIVDTIVYRRGNETYERPVGWLRFALNMYGKYPDDHWLGDRNLPGEWPVSYHGTTNNSAQAISDGGYKLIYAKRQLYGPGHYTSPHVAVAEAYATVFDWQGMKYKCILQNRVNPANLTKVEVAPKQYYWIAKSDADLRAYGICVKKM